MKISSIVKSNLHILQNSILGKEIYLVHMKYPIENLQSSK